MGKGGGGPLSAKNVRFYGRLTKPPPPPLMAVPFRRVKHFTLDNLTAYGHIKLKLSVGIFTGLLQYLPKNRAILVQKLGGKKIVKNRFLLF